MNDQPSVICNCIGCKCDSREEPEFDKKRSISDYIAGKKRAENDVIAFLRGKTVIFVTL